MNKKKSYNYRLNLARTAAADGMVLLKNENNVLPLSPEKTIALFGRNQIDTFKSGGGAADLWAVRVLPFADGLQEEGKIYQPLLKKYQAYSAANKNHTLNKIQEYYAWSLAEVPLTDDEVEQAAAACETAVVFIGRFSAEAFDIKEEKGEYFITDAEEKMISQVTKAFEKTVLVLNVPSLIDLTFLDKYSFDSIVYTSVPGMEAGHALADVLYGYVTPSGKLTDTWMKSASEYPTNASFATVDVIYSEGIYMGYKYFDTFNKDVFYPFGFGLSYTNFSMKTVSAKAEGTKVKLQISVTNEGAVDGREVVQCYLLVPDGELDQPYQILCGFAKTKLLLPGESEMLEVCINLLDFTSYSEERAAYILENGTYILRVGNHSRNTTPACNVKIEKTVVCHQVKNRILPERAICELKKPDTDGAEMSKVLGWQSAATSELDQQSAVSVRGQQSAAEQDISVIVPDFSNVETIVAPDEEPAKELLSDVKCSFADVLSGKCSPEELVAQLSDEELARMLTGDGPEKLKALGLPAFDLAKGEGSHTHPVPELAIPSSTMQDGPSGVRASAFTIPIVPDDELNGTDCVAFPCSTMLAATWDVDLVHEIGQAIVIDLDRCGFNGLCAPGVNLHRNPRCGRNFEYYSEDPFVSAQMAIAFINGVQKKDDGTPTKHYAVLKHFACNNSEAERMRSDSVLSERCARELYLRAFQMVIKEAEPLSIMTAYNKINGVYASANHDLLDGICRTEWNYDGWIMTDWCVWADTVECIKAGADIVMPGTYVSFDEMQMKGLDRATAQRRAVNLIKHLVRTKHYA